ncbi:MAG: hypothetical protein K8H88_12505, partial [Sandaracinaceae bacterium]|nr:hypothetical protein [Sandaracinaceae bacterium]
AGGAGGGVSDGTAAVGISGAVAGSGEEHAATRAMPSNEARASPCVMIRALDPSADRHGTRGR